MAFAAWDGIYFSFLSYNTPPRTSLLERGKEVKWDAQNMCFFFLFWLDNDINSSSILSKEKRISPSFETVLHAHCPPFCHTSGRTHH